MPRQVDEPPLSQSTEPGAAAVLLSGVNATRSLAAGAVVFGILFGVAAASRGFSGGEALLMSAMVFAGATQFAALELWAAPLSFWAIAVAAALVSSRHALMGLSLPAVLGRPGKRPPFGALFLLTDVSWILTTNDKAGPHRLAFFVGSGAAMYAGWVVGTALGVGIPGLLDERTLSGLGAAGPLFIGIMLVMLAKKSDKPPLLPWAMSAGVALAAQPFLGSSLAILFGVGASAAITLMQLRPRRA